MTAVLRTFLFAWQFLTAIPLSRSTHDAKPEELAASMSWYPMVGCLLGALLAAVDMALAQVFSSQVTNIVLILILVAITRGLHQDGLADMVDGLAGGRTAPARLAIMRDGRIGAIGATGLFLALGLRYAGLNAVPVGEPLKLAWRLCGTAVSVRLEPPDCFSRLACDTPGLMLCRRASILRY